MDTPFIGDINNNTDRFKDLPDQMNEFLLRHADQGFALLDEQLHFRLINQVLAGISSHSPEEHIGLSLADVWPQLPDNLLADLQTVVADGRSLTDVSLLLNGAQGKQQSWLLSASPLFTGPDRIGGVLLSARLQKTPLTGKSPLLARRVLDNLFTFVGVLSPDGTMLDTNRAPLDAAGIVAEDVIGKKFWDCFWWSYDPQAQQKLKQAVKRAAAGDTSRFDAPIRTAGDKRMMVDFMLAPLQDEEGRVTHLIPSAIDISDRVAGESMLRFSEERFRQVVEHTQDGLILTDNSGRILLVNQRASEMFGYANQEMYSLTVEDLVPDDIRPHHVSLRSGYQHNPQARAMAAMRELYAKRKNGTLFPVEIGLTPLEFPEGTRILATIIDISVQKDIQQNLIRSLNEKTALLNEVHHRVKNNLQVVSSLLSLQSRSVPEEVRSYFDESQGRIKAMALIHQLLYEQKNYDRIETVSYIRRLADLLKRSYFSQARNLTILIDADIEQSYLDLDSALPFGLLINELVTNSIKHAFPDGRAGEIHLSLTSSGPRHCLVIGDNGVGLPAGMGPGQSSSLGFQLVPGLADQMHAELQLLEGPGTVFHLIFNCQDADDEQQ